MAGSLDFLDFLLSPNVLLSVDLNFFVKDGDLALGGFGSVKGVLVPTGVGVASGVLSIDAAAPSGVLLNGTDVERFGVGRFSGGVGEVRFILLVMSLTLEVPPSKDM